MPFLAISPHPINLANRTLGIFDYTGPANYTTGGDVIPAGDLGFSQIDFMSHADLSLSGTYQVLILYPALGTQNVNTITIAWYVVSTGAQVAPGTNLSAEHVHLMVIGG